MLNNTMLVIMLIANACMSGFGIGAYDESADDKETKKLGFRVLFYGAFTVFFAIKIINLMPGE